MGTPVIKIGLGKLEFSGKAAGFIRLAETNNITILPIKTAHLTNSLFIATCSTTHCPLSPLSIGYPLLIAVLKSQGEFELLLKPRVFVQKSRL